MAAIARQEEKPYQNLALHPHFILPELWENTFVLFKSPSLWYFVMTAWANEYNDQLRFIPQVQDWLHIKKSVNALYHSNRTKEENHMSISIGEERVLDKINTLSWWKHLTPRNRKKLPSPDNIYEPPIASFTLNVEKLQRLHAFPRERCSLYPLIFSIVLKILTRTILGKKMR